MKFLFYVVLIAAPMTACTPLTHTHNATGSEPTVASWVNFYLSTPGCKQNPADSAKLAANLKGRYAIVSCYDAIKGWSQIILAPKSVEFPRMDIVYGNLPEQQPTRARFVDHYLVIEFERQQQYLDLLKPHAVSAFTRVGFVDDSFNPPEMRDFEDAHILLDAAKNYAGIGEKSDLATQLPGLVAEAAAGKPYTLSMFEAGGDWSVVIRIDGVVRLVWDSVYIRAIRLQK